MLLEITVLFIGTLLLLLCIIAYQIHELEKADKKYENVVEYAEKLKNEIYTLDAQREAWKNACLTQVQDMQEEDTDCV